LRLDEPGRGVLNVTSDGHAVVAGRGFIVTSAGRLTEPVSIDLAAGRARELRVWSHQVAADGWSSPIPARTTIDGEPGGADAAATTLETRSPEAAVFP